MTVQLRPMRWWDIEPAAALERELFEDDPWSEAGFWSELAGVPDSRFYLVAEETGAPASTGAVDPGRSDLGRSLPVVVGYAGLLSVGAEADVQTVAVAARTQGTGLGRRLVEGLLEEARRRRCSQVLLEVREDNHDALRLYERLGFESIARRSSYYGPGQDAVIMRLDLNSDGAGRAGIGRSNPSTQ
jgi:ribosomal-protein-alanine N-acetyltransferase